MDLLVYLLGCTIGLLDVHVGMNGLRPNVLRSQAVNAQHTWDRTGQTFNLSQILWTRRAPQQEAEILPKQADGVDGDDGGHHDGRKGVGQGPAPEVFIASALACGWLSHESIGQSCRNQCRDNT
jgi:hypothetical protein